MDEHDMLTLVERWRELVRGGWDSWEKNGDADVWFEGPFSDAETVLAEMDQAYTELCTATSPPPPQCPNCGRGYTQHSETEAHLCRVATLSRAR